MINCPFHLGQRVTVSPTAKYASDWPGEYLVVGLSWHYQYGMGEVDVTIASADDIANRDGSTDGWSIEDLLPARI
jgi:hypothetical protein